MVLECKSTTGNPKSQNLWASEAKGLDFFHSASDTTSLQSEVRHYKYENGRRYHAYSEGQYWGPNDDKQNEQLDIL